MKRDCDDPSDLEGSCTKKKKMKTDGTKAKKTDPGKPTSISSIRTKVRKEATLKLRDAGKAFPLNLTIADTTMRTRKQSTLHLMEVEGKPSLVSDSTMSIISETSVMDTESSLLSNPRLMSLGTDLSITKGARLLKIGTRSDSKSARGTELDVKPQLSSMGTLMNLSKGSRFFGTKMSSIREESLDSEVDVNMAPTQSMEMELSIKKEPSSVDMTEDFEGSDLRTEMSIANNWMGPADHVKTEPGTSGYSPSFYVDLNCDPEPQSKLRGDSSTIKKFRIKLKPGSKKRSPKALSKTDAKEPTQDGIFGKKAQKSRPVCSHCHGVFYSSSSLKRHYQRKHATDSLSFVCQECHAAFPRLMLLRAHERTHKGPSKTFPCQECDVVFTRACHLRVHMRKHTGERPFTCKECDATFRSTSNLNRHMLKHGGDRRYVCTVCQADFYQASHLVSHVRKHTGERPFSCEDCKATFTQYTHLHRHRSKHTGRKPYVCATCGQGFVENCALKRHMLAHKRKALAEATKAKNNQRKYKKQAPF